MTSVPGGQAILETEPLKVEVLRDVISDFALTRPSDVPHGLILLTPVLPLAENLHPAPIKHLASLLWAPVRPARNKIAINRTSAL